MANASRCCTNMIVNFFWHESDCGFLWHESYCAYSVARIHCLYSAARIYCSFPPPLPTPLPAWLILPPPSQPPSSQPASQPASLLSIVSPPMVVQLCTNIPAFRRFIGGKGSTSLYELLNTDTSIVFLALLSMGG